MSGRYCANFVGGNTSGSGILLRFEARLSSKAVCKASSPKGRWRAAEDAAARDGEREAYKLSRGNGEKFHPLEK